jgi:hypothetical protein
MTPPFEMTPVVPVDYGAQLNEARAAFHNLMMGGAAVVYVDQNGERVEYRASNAKDLSNYILRLETLLGIDTRRVMGPMSVFMGR